MRKIEFKNAEPLIQYIGENKAKIIGKHIRRFYSTKQIRDWSDVPIVFEFDDYSIVVSYFFLSDMTLAIVDPQMVKDDCPLNFLCKGPEDPDYDRNWVFEIKDFPFLGEEISDISVERFSHEFEIDPSTGETRPEGGDYFSVITVSLASGREMHICAADTMCDGYVMVW